MRSPSHASILCVRLALGALLAGCGGPGAETGEETGEAPIAEADAAARIAEAHCEQLTACTCDERPFTSVTACIEEVRGELEAEAQAAQAAGWSYDGACAASIIADIEALGCSNEPPQIDAQSCQSQCFVYAGTEPLDAECTGHNGGYLMPTAACEQGLHCQDYAGGEPYAVCEDACSGKAVVGEGANCGADIATCAEGFWCSQFGCTAKGAVGENCGEQLDTCGPGAVCEIQQDPGLCIPSIPEGGACMTGFDNHCDPYENLRCVEDECVPEEPWICRRWR